MPHIVLARETDWDGWRNATRAHVLAGTPPETLTWSIGGTAIPLGNPLPDGPPAQGGGSFGVPRALVALAAQAIQARDPDRFDLLYRLVWRAQAGEPVLEQRDDPELTRARRLALAVRAEAHRMRTHLRYLALPDTHPTHYLGWVRPRALRAGGERPTYRPPLRPPPPGPSSPRTPPPTGTAPTCASAPASTPPWSPTTPPSPRSGATTAPTSSPPPAPAPRSRQPRHSTKTRAPPTAPPSAPSSCPSTATPP